MVLVHGGNDRRRVLCILCCCLIGMPGVPGRGRVPASPSSATTSAVQRRANRADSAPFVPRSVVANPYFDWSNDRPPRTPYHQSVIYEAHVRGLTMQHPAVPAGQRGTYAGLAHPAVVEHLLDLGVTAVELMPVHQFVSDGFLAERGLSNYWGYNTIGFFAPHNAYSSAGELGEQVPEFKAMVRALHEAGLEVILDVVYNHTAEGNHLGPTLSFRGIDNATYYRLTAEPDRSHYFDTTGTGNSLLDEQPARAAADHGLAAVLGAGDARRRLPLRPGELRSHGSSTRWTTCRRSSSWCSRIRSSPRSS